MNYANKNSNRHLQNWKNSKSPESAPDGLPEAEASGNLSAQVMGTGRALAVLE